MNCTAVRYQLPDHTMGKLSQQESSAVSEHLLVCPECRAEATQLEDLFAELKAAPFASPPPNYFGALLPKIHRRMEERNERFVPSWVARFVLPAAAAALCVFLVLKSVPTVFRSDEPSLKSVLLQLRTEELQEVLDHQLSSNVLESSGMAESQWGSESSNDKEVLVAILQDEEKPFASTEFLELESQSPYENMNEQDAMQILAILQQETFMD